MQRTPLYSLQQTLGAKMVPFAGWEMPIQYQGVLAEHQAVRTQAGIFDISHMGRWVIEGSHLRDSLNHLVPTDLSPLLPGQGQYTVLLNEQGGIIDDVILYCDRAGDPERWIVIVNAATQAQDWQWVQSHLPQVTMTDWGASHLLLAVQGPEAASVIQPTVREPLTDLKRFQQGWFTPMRDPATPLFITRTGYTGEDGFEIMPPLDLGLALWQDWLSGGLVPCGLGCRDTLRLEAAMHLYGQDMDADITPLEAGLSWLVHWHKPDFIGRAALLQQKEQGIPRQLVGLQMQTREIARSGYAIHHQGSPVGIITSGTKSPSLGIPIALGYVPPPLSAVGTALTVLIRGQEIPALVVKRPFYRSSRPAPR